MSIPPSHGNQQTHQKGLGQSWLTLHAPIEFLFHLPFGGLCNAHQHPRITCHHRTIGVLHRHAFHGEHGRVARYHGSRAIERRAVDQSREHELVAYRPVIERVVGKVGDGLYGVLAVLVCGLSVPRLISAQAQVGQRLEETRLSGGVEKLR